MTAAELFFRAILDGFELSTRKPDGRARPPALTLQICICNVRTINVMCALLKPQHTTNHDSIRNTEALAAQLVNRTGKPLPIEFLRLVKIAREESNNGIERF